LFAGELDLLVIDKIGGFTTKESMDILQKLVLDRFIVRNRDGICTFSHDKILETILNNIEPEKKNIFYERVAIEYVKLIDNDKSAVFTAAEYYLKTTNLQKSFQYSLQAAIYAVEKAAFDVAIKQYRNCILIADRMKENGFVAPLSMTKIEIDMGDVLMSSGRNEQALEIYNKVLEKGNFKDHYTALHTKYKIGCIYHNTGSFDKSIPLFVDTLKELSLKIPSRGSNLIFSLTVEFLIQIFYSFGGKIFCRKRNNPNDLLKAKILNKLSYSFYFNDMKSSLFPHLKAMNIVDILVDTYEKAESFTLHAVPCYQLLLRKRGFDHLKKSVRIAEKLNRRDVLAFSESMYAILYYFTADWLKSEKYLKASIKNYQSIGDNSSQLICMEHIWRLHMMKGDFTAAKAQMGATIEMCQDVNENHFFITTKAAQYYLNILLGNQPDRKSLQEIEQLTHKISSHLSVTHVGIYLISADLLQGNIPRAYERISELLPKAKRNVNSEYSVPLLDIHGELILKKLMGNDNRKEEKKLRKEFLKNWFVLAFSSISYPAYRGTMWRQMAWYSLNIGNHWLADKLFKRSIKKFHKYDMKYEKAKSLRDYGLFLNETNSPGFARDQFDAAYVLFQSCNAVLEVNNIKSKVSSHVIRPDFETVGNSPFSHAKENSNLIRFDTLLEVSTSMPQINELSVLREKILSSLIKSTGAQYGCFLTKTQAGEMKIELLKDFTGKDLRQEDVIISQSIIEKTEIQKQVVLEKGSDTASYRNGSNEQVRGRSVLCTPLYRENNYMGCVYLGNDKVAGLFSENAVKTAQIISAQASCSMAIIYLSQDCIQLKQDRDNKVKQQTHDMREKNHQLELINLKLVESERMKGILSGTLVHDIKNYAAGIEGNLQYLSRRLTGDMKIRRILDVVGETCADIVSLASNLLDIAKMDEGKLIVRTERLSSEYIESMAEKFLKNPLFEEKDISPRILPSLCNFTIDVDVYLLERIFQNIFSNAAKYVPRSGKVELSFHKNEKNVEICFFNSGIPIPDKEKEVLFEKYARLDNRQSQYSKGLGLFFCRMVMNAHKGRIWVETDELGNYFKLSFPHSAVMMLQNTGS
jgi:signal transduction histidine kinase/tetratricopeptide (TPR) repeat protein